MLRISDVQARGTGGLRGVRRDGCMLRISDVQALDGRRVRLTLTDGSIVERDLDALLDGVGVFERITVDDDAFREVYVDEGGTLAWPGDVDLAPETLIWDGPDPLDWATRTPEPFLRLRKPSYTGALTDAYGDVAAALAEERGSWPEPE